MSEIAACIRCASTDLDMPRLRDGIIPETDNLGEFVCRRCDLRAIPVIFDDVRSYEAFAKQHRASEGDD